MTAFDEPEFRKSAAAVREYLPSDIEEHLLNEHGDWAAVLNEMTLRAAATSTRLAKHGRHLPVAVYPQLAVATIAARSKGIQHNPTNIAKTLDRLVANDVPMEIGLQSRWLTDDSLLGLLACTWRIEREVLAGPTTAPPMIVTMVAAALARSLGSTTPDLATRVRAALDRADELVAAHLERVPPRYGVDSRFVVLGNAEIVGLVAACRTAVLEAAGRLTEPVADSVDGGFHEVTRQLRRALTTPLGRRDFRDGKEVDSLAAFTSFARFIGGTSEDGKAVAAVFECLHHDLMALDVVTRGELDISFDNVPEPKDMSAPTDLLLAAELLAHHLLHALYAGVPPIQREVVTKWLAGERPPDDQDELLLLVERMRRATHTLVQRTEPPELGPDLRARLPAMTTKVKDMLLLGHTGTEIVNVLLPTLWTRRSAAIRFVQSQLRVAMTSRQAVGQKSRLVASAVVRAPSQWVIAGATPAAPVCACGADEDRLPAKRTNPAEDQVCPHRTWDEPGPVESYTTLAEFADLAGVDAVRVSVRRYEGPWRYWLRAAFSLVPESAIGE